MVSMTTYITKYEDQCVTCNLAADLNEATHDFRRNGVPYTHISQFLLDHGVKISTDALSNHFRRHVSFDSTPAMKTNLVPVDEVGGYDPEITLPPLLGVVKPPKGWEAKFELDGDTGSITSTPQTDDKISDFSQILEEFGIDSTEFEIDGTAKISKWQSASGQWLTSYKFNIKKKSHSVDISDLIKLVQDVKPQTPVTTGDYTFVFAAGDLQLGKSDGDGVEGTVRRYRESLQKAVNKVHEHKEQIGTILVSFVGDCIEGMVSQGGRNARRTVLSTTQQVNLLRQLMIETVKSFAPLTGELILVSVPGNHDEAQREPVSTDGSDSWAVDALRAVSQGLAFNPEAFGHVTCEEVAFDELTKVVEVSGTKIGHAHGHQWKKGKHWDWWSGQHWGGHEIGEADILLCGHFHTGMYEQENYKHIIRTPAFEQESTYFRHMTGKIGNPSAVTFLTKDGKLNYIDFE
jgi:predicted phosphodiesterase